MGALRGAFVGVLSLGALEMVVANPMGTGAVATIAGLAGQIIQRVVDPNVPAIPDLSTPADTSPSTDNTHGTPAPSIPTRPPIPRNVQ